MAAGISAETGWLARGGGLRPRAAEIFAESGFVGIAEGPEDLSTRYKEVLTEDLEAKHGGR